MKAANWAGLSSRYEKAHALAARGAEGHPRREFCSETRLPRVLTCNMQLFVAPDYCSQGSAPLVDHDLRFDSVCD
jgi:hypothetical protein